MGRWSGLAIEKKYSTALMKKEKHFLLRFMGNTGHPRLVHAGSETWIAYPVRAAGSFQKV